MSPDIVPSSALVELVRARVKGRGDQATHEENRSIARREEPLIASTQLDALVGALMSEVRGLGPLDALLNDPTVTDVMVNGPASIWVDRSGAAERV